MNELLWGVLGWLIGAAASSAVILTWIEVYYRRQRTRSDEQWAEVFRKMEGR